mmetsp:Transcript_11722/g.13482  ORF Transcript_11722/g.13482 Transcript_11722/m.13482 type:complete len:80 (+) Transcript_11722:1032-1271(+)
MHLQTSSRTKLKAGINIDSVSEPSAVRFMKVCNTETEKVASDRNFFLQIVTSCHALGQAYCLLTGRNLGAIGGNSKCGF